MKKIIADGFPIIKGLKSTFLKNHKDIGKLKHGMRANAKFPMLITSVIVSQYFTFTD